MTVSPTATLPPRWTQAKMRSVQTLMQYLNVAPDLEFRVKQYYEFKFSTKTLFSDHDIFDELPAKIRQDLVLHRYEHVIDKVTRHDQKPFVHVCVCWGGGLLETAVETVEN